MLKYAVMLDTNGKQVTMPFRVNVPKEGKKVYHFDTIETVSGDEPKLKEFLDIIVTKDGKSYKLNTSRVEHFMLNSSKAVIYLETKNSIYKTTEYIRRMSEED